MTRRRPPRLRDADCERLDEIGRSAGLDRVGWCVARSWTSTRSSIEERRDDGRHAGMVFTFKNPARSSDPTRVLRDAATLFVGARSYAQSVEAAPQHIGVPARVARYATADHYGRLREGLDAIASELRDLGARTVVVADSNSVVDREAAWRSGIGWFGKNSLVLVPGAGSWFVLGSVVTDAVVDASVAPPRPVADGCGACARCVDACPTGAIVEPGVVDARRCLAWLVQAPGTFPEEFRRALGDRIYGCDDCQDVCPPNRTVELRSRHGQALPIEADPGSWLDAFDLMDLSDEELLERCARWYIAGRDPAIVRRNLLIVLGNSGRSDDQRVTDLVERYRKDDDPILAEHADWAAAALAGASRADDN